MKYKVGDKVIPICGNGIGNFVIEEMNDLIGKVCTVKTIMNKNIYLKECSFAYSPSWLKPAEIKKSSKKIKNSEINILEFI